MSLAMEAPQLPTHFPCWVKAVYSWGGESKRDLGFIEGDIIECLNAGDGSWWTGRLLRDKRSVGCFPSNFVKVLPDDWTPYRKASLTNSGRLSSGSHSAPTTPAPQKQKSVFRKPFQAYGNVGSRNGSQSSLDGTPSPPEKVSNKWKPMQPYSSMKSIQSHRPIPARSSPLRAPSPPPVIPKPVPRATAGHPRMDSKRLSTRPASPNPAVSRAPSPQPDLLRARSPLPQQHHSRAPSPNPYQQNSRAPSPSPHQQYSRAPSPNPHQQYSRAPSPQPQQHYHRSASPQPRHSSNQSASSFQYDSLGRAPSPRPVLQQYSQQQDISRAPSPRPSFQPVDLPEPDIPFPSRDQTSRLASREPSPVPFHESYRTYASHPPQANAGPPPPPPPAHRSSYAQQEAMSQHEQYYHQTPARPSPSHSANTGMTPSPLRDAMNDVMNSLEGMGMSDADKDQREESPPAMWGPDDYEIVRSNSARAGRPHTALGGGADTYDSRGFNGAEQHNDFDDDDDQSVYPQLPARDGPPQLNNYVQRMEERLRRLQQQDEVEQYLPQRQKPQDRTPTRSLAQGSPLPSRSARPMSMYTDHRSTGISYADDDDDDSRTEILQSRPSLKKRKSAIEFGREKLHRTFTGKTNTTDSTAPSTNTYGSSGTSTTGQSLMSGQSAGGFSATSAGSLARRKFGRSNSIKNDLQRPATAMSGVSYHSSHASGPNQTDEIIEPRSDLGGLAAPTPPKRGFFRKIIDSAKTTAASSRGHMSSASESRLPGRPKSRNGASTPSAISGGSFSGLDAAREMGLGGGPAGGVDWVQTRRDVNRSNSLSENERRERRERCQMMDKFVISPTDIIEETVQGDEDAHRRPILEPVDFQSVNLSMVDKSSRFVSNLPSAINPISLAQTYLCRPYRSDVQKLRAIFTWVSERISWEDDYEGDIDARQVILSKRGCSEEIAVLVTEMCAAVGIHAEIVRGYLKSPLDNLHGQDLNDVVAHPNHWWNAVLVDDEWRIMDCALANPSHAKRSLFSSVGVTSAEFWYFLARPTEIYYSHVPLLPEQQHVVPPVAHDILMALPVGCPAFFRNGLRMFDFDTSLLHLEGLEMAHIQIAVPDDVECVAEVETRSFAYDADGDMFESGDVLRKRALAQAEFMAPAGAAGSDPWKRYTIKAVLPSMSNSSTTATLKVYAGKRGLMHGINSNPHGLALTLPMTHEGQNPEYDFFTRHPTPHALRHELYVTGPLCKTLAANNTFVFGVRQHPGNPNALAVSAIDKRPKSAAGNRPMSALSIVRPGSAMSMTSTSASGSSYSNPSASGSESSSGSYLQREKPAKLAIQSPSGKVMRMTRKADHGSSIKRGGSGYRGGKGQVDDDGDKLETAGSNWEIVVKISERGTWRGLVLADRSARWCVFGEWECV